MKKLFLSSAGVMACLGLAMAQPVSPIESMIHRCKISDESTPLYMEGLDASSFREDINGTLDLLQDLVDDYCAEWLTTQERQQIAAFRTFLSSSGLLGLQGRVQVVARDSALGYRHFTSFMVDSSGSRFSDLLVAPSSPTTSRLESYLPEQTAVACTLSVDAAGLLRWFADGVRPFDSALADRVLSVVASANGVGTVDRGTLLALTFMKDAAWGIQGTKFMSARPGLLMGQAVKDAMLWESLKAALKEGEASGVFTLMPVTCTDAPEMEVLALPIQDDTLTGLGIVPVVAYDKRSSVILAATSQDVLFAAVAAGHAGRGRLLESACFRERMVPNQVHSDFVWVSPETVPNLVAIVRDFSRAGFFPLTAKEEKYLRRVPSFWLSSIAVREAEFIDVCSRTSLGPCNTLRLLGASLSTLASHISSTLVSLQCVRARELCKQATDDVYTINDDEDDDADDKEELTK